MKIIFQWMVTSISTSKAIFLISKHRSHIKYDEFNIFGVRTQIVDLLNTKITYNALCDDTHIHPWHPTI